MRRIEAPVLQIVDRFPHRSHTFILNEFSRTRTHFPVAKLLATRGVDRALCRKWDDARLVSDSVISGNFSLRRALLPYTTILARLHSKRWSGSRRKALIASAFSKVRSVEIAHFHFLTMGHAALAMKLPEISGAHILVSVRGKELSTKAPEKLARYLRPMVDRGTTFLPVCDYFRDLLVEQGQVPPELIHTHYSGIPSAFFRLTDSELNARAASESWTVYVAGRMVEKKGMAQAVEAFSSARQQLGSRRNMRLLLAGDGPQRQRILERVRDLNLSECTEVQGVFTPEQHRQNLLRSHLFLSLNETLESGETEGIPNSIKEAMAAQLPVIATDHAGNREVVSHGTTGIIVEEKDAEAAAAAILSFCEDDGRALQFGAEGRAVIESRFDLRVTVEQLSGLYRQLLGNEREQLVCAL